MNDKKTEHHGELFGCHVMMYKLSAFYNCLTHIPEILYHPGQDWNTACWNKRPGSRFYLLPGLLFAIIVKQFGNHIATHVPIICFLAVHTVRLDRGHRDLPSLKMAPLIFNGYIQFSIFFFILMYILF